MRCRGRRRGSLFAFVLADLQRSHRLMAQPEKEKKAIKKVRFLMSDVALDPDKTGETHALWYGYCCYKLCKNALHKAIC